MLLVELDHYHNQQAPHLLVRAELQVGLHLCLPLVKDTAIKEHPMDLALY
jgi:hypothetical protein